MWGLLPPAGPARSGARRPVGSLLGQVKRAGLLQCDQRDTLEIALVALLPTARADTVLPVTPRDVPPVPP